MHPPIAEAVFGDGSGAERRETVGLVPVDDSAHRHGVTDRRRLTRTTPTRTTPTAISAMATGAKCHVEGT